MVFNNEDKTLTQVKAKRRKIHNNSFLNKMISPSVKYEKNGISQIAVNSVNSIDNKKVGLNHDIISINSNTETTIQVNEAYDRRLKSENSDYCYVKASQLSELSDLNHKITDESDRLENTGSHTSNENHIENRFTNLSLNISTIHTNKESSSSQNTLISGTEDEMRPNGKTSERLHNKKNVLKTMKGITLAFISALFFSITTVIVKYVSDVHPGEMAFFRFLGNNIFLFLLLYSYYYSFNLRFNFSS